jgi:hypothetical protein
VRERERERERVRERQQISNVYVGSGKNSVVSGDPSRNG